MAKKLEGVKKEQIGVVNIGNPCGPNTIDGVAAACDAVMRGLIFELVVDPITFKGHLVLYRPLNEEGMKEAEAQFLSMCG